MLVFRSMWRGRCPNGCGGLLSYEERIEACEEAGGGLVPATQIAVQELKSSNGNVTAYLELFNGADCEADSVAFVSTRSGIQIQKGEPQGIHMTPLCKGHFTSLPSPSRVSRDLLLRELALTECSVDCDCVEPFKEI